MMNSVRAASFTFSLKIAPPPLRANSWRFHSACFFFVLSTLFLLDALTIEQIYLSVFNSFSAANFRFAMATPPPKRVQNANVQQKQQKMHMKAQQHLEQSKVKER